MLAATSIGAIWSSCSPDFGEQGVLDRFGQIEPKLFIACDAYWYNGKLQDVQSKGGERSRKSLGVPVAGRPLCRRRRSASRAPRAGRHDACRLRSLPIAAKPVEFVQLPFAHPLYILFSSGTTGVPKCIVHSAGGTLLQHLKEHRLHCGVQPRATSCSTSPPAAG